MIVGQFAFERSGRNPAPTCAAISGGAIALAVVVAVGVFVGSVDRLDTVPAAHGWPWNLMIGNPNFYMDKGTARQIQHDARFAAVTSANYGQVTIGGISTEALAYDPHGGAPPQVISGRLPRTAGEIALGAKLMEKVHTRGRVDRSALARGRRLPGRPER